MSFPEKNQRVCSMLDHVHWNNGQAHSSRREFVCKGILSFVLLSGLYPWRNCPANEAAPFSFSGVDVFRRIVKAAKAGKWGSLPIGELMGKIARELEGTPYLGGTLDKSVDSEICTINLNALDCVTFFECTLDLARMLKNGGTSEHDLLKEVRFTRYRGGLQGDYSTRLHYSTDWFYDNQEKGVVKILADLPGSEPFKQKVAFMSANPDKYKQLAAHPELLSKMRACEGAINKRKLTYVPSNKLALAESYLKTGDIVGACTNIAGLDIAHTGIVYRDSDGIAHFMDASSKKANMKVTIEEGPISAVFSNSKAWTGAMFARPLEIK